MWADNAVSKINTDYEIGPNTVTLSEAKVYRAGLRDASLRLSMTGFACHPERSEGSVALGVEMLRCAQHDSIVRYVASSECHPEPQRRVCRAGLRDASLHSA